MRAVQSIAILAGLLLLAGQSYALPITLDSVRPEAFVPGLDATFKTALSASAAEAEANQALPLANISLLALGGLAFVSLRYHRSKKRQWRRIQDEISHRIAV